MKHCLLLLLASNTSLQVGYPVPVLFPVKFEDVGVLKCLKDSALILCVPLFVNCRGLPSG